MALGAASGRQVMYHQQTDLQLAEWEFGAVKGPQSGASFGENVSTARLSQFVRFELRGRSLPASLPASLPPSRSPTVVLKLDVEGAELEILSDLWVSGLLCDGSISLVTVEFHSHLWRRGALSEHAMLFEVLHRLAHSVARDRIGALRDRARRARARMRAQVWQAAARAGSDWAGLPCPTPAVVSDLDDETYALVPDSERRPWETEQVRE
jgi:hypothetical protein